MHVPHASFRFMLLEISFEADYDAKAIGMFGVFVDLSGSRNR